VASARRLSERFSTLSAVLSADQALVADLVGQEAAAAVAQVRGIMAHALDDELRQRRAILCERDVARFLKELIGFRAEEALIVLFLDARRCLIDHEILATGRADSVEFDQRRIIFRAIGRGATGLILAHNHPSGDPRPSSSDIRVTRQLGEVARSLGICLHDHLVVAGGEVRSAMGEW